MLILSIQAHLHRHVILISAFICFIFRMFCCTFTRIYGLNVIIYTSILVLCLGIALGFWPNNWPPFECTCQGGTPSSRPVEPEKGIKFWSQLEQLSDHRVPHGSCEHVTASPSSSFIMRLRMLCLLLKRACYKAYKEENSAIITISLLLSHLFLLVRA